VTRALVLAAWVLVVLFLAGAELLPLTGHRRYTGIGGLLRRVTNGRLRLLVLFVAWMWVGWHFFAR
jgi:Family of unknown function (DUF6186)